MAPQPFRNHCIFRNFNVTLENFLTFALGIGKDFKFYVKSMLVLQNFSTARKSGNISWGHLDSSNHVYPHLAI